MKKVMALLVVVASVGGFFAYKAMAFNFSGSQSLNGLQTTQIFAAPQAGVYFVNGQLSLPQSVAAGGAGSSVVAVVTVGASTVYSGLPGANGFQINQLSLGGGSVVSVQLSSGAANDQVLNAVRGQVYYGNTF